MNSIQWKMRKEGQRRWRRTIEKMRLSTSTIEPVPVFQSDSEDEEDVFIFETAITRPTSGKGGGENAN